MHYVEFRGPVAVVIARLPETNAVVFGLIGQRGRVRIELCRRAGTGLRHKQIDAQRTRRQLPRRDDAFGEHIRRKKARGDEAETTRVCRRRGKLGR
jgi:hypothetical protein